jgi:hypothetical protein
MHIRSGDIFHEPIHSEGHYAHGHYAQPPCAYYSDIIMHGNNGGPFHHVLVVTHKDKANPCIGVLQTIFPRVQVQTSDLLEDACTIIAAENLVLAFGSFGPLLSRLNPTLRHLFVPMVKPVKDIWFKNLSICWKGAAYTQHVYTFPGYNYEWTSVEDRVTKMTTYDSAGIDKVTLHAVSSTPA